MTRRHALKGLVMGWSLMLTGGTAQIRVPGQLSPFGHRLACLLATRAARAKWGWVFRRRWTSAGADAIQARMLNWEADLLERNMAMLRRWGL